MVGCCNFLFVMGGLLSQPANGISMFDCPEQIHTSPIITLESWIFFPSEIVMV